tara:strand:+ start:12540 stop:13070 length:531 start_codon:yes stop_codon:yes gene_type:complete
MFNQRLPVRSGKPLSRKKTDPRMGRRVYGNMLFFGIGEPKSSAYCVAFIKQESNLKNYTFFLFLGHVCHGLFKDFPQRATLAEFHFMGAVMIYYHSSVQWNGGLEYLFVCRIQNGGISKYGADLRMCGDWNDNEGNKRNEREYQFAHDDSPRFMQCCGTDVMLSCIIVSVKILCTL